MEAKIELPKVDRVVTIKMKESEALEFYREFRKADTNEIAKILPFKVLRSIHDSLSHLEFNTPFLITPGQAEK